MVGCATRFAPSTVLRPGRARSGIGIAPAMVVWAAVAVCVWWFVAKKHKRHPVSDRMLSWLGKNSGIPGKACERTTNQDRSISHLGLREVEMIASFNG